MRSLRADLIAWGLFEGLLAFLILAWIAPQWQGDILALSVIVLLGGVISTVVFGLLGRMRCLGFLVLSCLLPSVTVVGGDSLNHGRPYLAGPLTIGFIILWIVLLLPSALVAMLVFRWVTPAKPEL